MEPYDTFIKLGGTPNTVKNKVVEGARTAIDSVSRVFENAWQKFLFVFHKFKWALLAMFIVIVVTVALGILHKLGLSQPIARRQIHLDSDQIHS